MRNSLDIRQVVIIICGEIVDLIPDFRRLTASTLASARPMYPTQRRPHSQLSEGLGKGRARTNSRTRGGKSFHAPQGEAREKNRSRAKAPVRKLHRGRVGNRKTSPAGVQKAEAKKATINYTESFYQKAKIGRNCKVHRKCDKSDELRTHGGTAALPCNLAYRVENLSVSRRRSPGLSFRKSEIYVAHNMMSSPQGLRDAKRC